MKKQTKLFALLLAVVLLVSGCAKAPDGQVALEDLFEKTSASLGEGHLFFAGRVTSALAEPKQITYYDAEAGKNTFYRVEITEDFFGCLPNRTLTVCVMGNSENFAERENLEKGKEYLFDCSIWMEEDQVILLLPTFYQALPQREGEKLLRTQGEETAAVKGGYSEYKEKLKSLAAESGYDPALVLQKVKDQLQAASLKDEAYFEKLEFENPDRALINATVAGASARLKAAEQTEESWKGIKELLK